MNFIQQCDTYLGCRTGKYEWRQIRYRATGDAMFPNLRNEDTLYDMGAGMTELDYCLRVDYDWRGRYIPIDGGIDGTNLETWFPPRRAEWFVGLEIIEHLYNWRSMVTRAQFMANKGVVLSTPNPRTTDVLGMDETHVSIIQPCDLEEFGFTVEERSFYGQPNDSLFAVWTR